MRVWCGCVLVVYCYDYALPMQSLISCVRLHFLLIFFFLFPLSYVCVCVVTQGRDAMYYARREVEVRPAAVPVMSLP